MRALNEAYAELVALCEEVTDADLMKSLQTLIKYNQGKFKSSAQAAFLYKSLLQHQSPTAQSWGQRWMTDPNAIAVQLTSRIEGFGRRTISKVRMFGFLYVVDGAGVLRAAKAQIDHSKGGSAITVTGAKDELFQRHGETPVLYDRQAELKAQDARAQSNAPMISKIQGVPAYNTNDFLQSLVGQLQSGRKLSPAQQGALAKYMPVDMGDATEWKAAFEKGVKLIDTRIAGPWVKAMREKAANIEAILASRPPDVFSQFEKNDPEKQQRKVNQERERLLNFADKIDQGWKEWKRKPIRHDEINASGSQLGMMMRWLGWMPSPHQGSWDLTFLWSLLAASKSKGKTGAKTLKMVPEGLRFVDWLGSVNSSEVERIEKRAG